MARTQAESGSGVGDKAGKAGACALGVTLNAKLRTSICR